MLWGWIEAALKFAESKCSTSLDLSNSNICWPSHSIDDFSQFYGICTSTTSSSASSKSIVESEYRLHTVIMDAELEKPIGMVSILQNNPKHLSASLGNKYFIAYSRSSVWLFIIYLTKKLCIGNIWITPKFQDKKRAFEAVYLICKSLFEAGKDFHLFIDAQ